MFPYIFFVVSAGHVGSVHNNGVSARLQSIVMANGKSIPDILSTLNLMLKA